MRVPALLATLCLAIGSGCTAGPPALPSSVATTGRPPSARQAVTQRVFGLSVRGRALRAWRLGNPGAARRVLVVGVIHGDEVAGRAVALDLLQRAVPSGAVLVVVPDANPDGAAAGTRQNANGVDLNRNFPHDWRPIGRRGAQQYSGSGPLSEPESRAMVALIRDTRPTVTIWFHQPVGVVDESGGSLSVERRFAAVLGEPLRRLERYPGSAVGWENHVLDGTTAFVVELPRHPSAALVQRAVTAVASELRA